MMRNGAVPYRFVDDVPGVYRVENEKTGKMLGRVIRQGAGKTTHWKAQASRMAFLGDGPDGPDPLADIVPLELYQPLAEEFGDPCIPGEFRTRDEAARGLQTYLAAQQAPAMNFRYPSGRHPRVRRAAVSR
jgi:hypothetical protein